MYNRGFYFYQGLLIILSNTYLLHNCLLIWLWCAINFVLRTGDVIVDSLTKSANFFPYWVVRFHTGLSQGLMIIKCLLIWHLCAKNFLSRTGEVLNDSITKSVKFLPYWPDYWSIQQVLVNNQAGLFFVFRFPVKPFLKKT